ncbi:MAG: imidazole glycerol phosphate synthase subunit HisH [Bacillota bacterium]
MIGIIDYGMGNLRSVEKAFAKLGLPVFISGDPGRLAEAKALVLPGVGAFGKAAENLRAGACIPLIKEWIAAERPFLGICLGLQLLFEKSEEVFDDKTVFPAGLGIIPGMVKRFPERGLKIPQIGWNNLLIRKRAPYFAETQEGAYVYFVHSYYVEPADRAWIAAETDYGIRYCSAVSTERMLAVQFHPEKSSRVGLGILKKFGEMMQA